MPCPDSKPSRLNCPPTLPLLLLNPVESVYKEISGSAFCSTYPLSVLSPDFGLYPFSENPCPTFGCSVVGEPTSKVPLSPLALTPSPHVTPFPSPLWKKRSALRGSGSF